MPKVKDFSHLINVTFNYLTLKEIKGRRNGGWLCLFMCNCGAEYIGLLGPVKTGNTKSCGCEKVKALIARSTKHGLAYHPLIHVHREMIYRCHNPKHARYKDYGGRGITVCDDWRFNFLCFYEWAIKNGWEKGKEIDRFPDNNKGYFPENCRITDRISNQRNKRNNILITYNNETFPLSVWCEKLSLSYSMVRSRYYEGFDTVGDLFSLKYNRPGSKRLKKNKV
jgi:hypothetical protein